MTENEKDPKEILAEIQAGLDADTVAERETALNALRELSFGSAALLRKLEQMALNDRSKSVRAAALETLTLPLYRQIQARNSSLPPHSRQMIANEIARWQADGLLDEQQTAVLRERYAFDLKPAPVMDAPAAPEPEAPKPKRTLAQTLFSETSIKVALYLGAFFIISAAAIFAAAIEELRLPILFFFTFGFGAGSLVLKKKLPQPSFTLFIIFSVLLPIDAAVIADQAHFGGRATHLYFFFVYFVMTGIWAYATWLFRSRFFSLIALIALDISFFNLATTFGDSVFVEWYFLLFTSTSLLGVGAAFLLERWKDEKFARPLFWLAQAQQIVLLFASFLTALFRYDDSDFAQLYWLLISATWWLSAAFYLFSNWVKKNIVFRALAVITLMPLSWFFLNIFDASENLQAIVFFVWGAVFALSGEALHKLTGKFQEYGQLLIFGAVPLVGFSVLLRVDANNTLAFTLALLVALLYTALSIYRARLWTWAYALIAALTAYALFWQFDALQAVELSNTFKLLIPSLLLLLPDLFLKNDVKANPNWRMPPRVLGASLTLATVSAALVPPDRVWHSSLVYALYALLAFGYALRYAPEFAYAANAFLSLAIIYLLLNADAEHWVTPLISLAVLFYFVGLGLNRFAREKWAQVYTLSGLLLGLLVAASAPFEDLGAVKSIPVVIAAGLFTVEAFRKRNLWLGFPANALYLMAYFMLLFNFEIEQPQYYSVAAAMLGMLMHYLLVRAESKTAAFITGMLSQLALLTTTYFQLVAEESLIYFAVLFFQALVVLVYGIVIRSRSLVITPIIFLVLGVLTVTVNLVGEFSIFLIGCTGVLLIVFAIGALLLRERFASLREQLDDWNA